jgi:hypothetical protein
LCVTEKNNFYFSIMGKLMRKKWQQQQQQKIRLDQPTSIPAKELTHVSPDCWPGST